jgi:hypothetical protein
MQNLDIKDEGNENEKIKTRAAMVYVEDAACMWREPTANPCSICLGR